MIIGNSKGVNNRHVQFGSITSSRKGCNGHRTYKDRVKCIHELLNVFEDSAQREHTIVGTTKVWAWSMKNIIQKTASLFPDYNEAVLVRPKQAFRSAKIL